MTPASRHAAVWTPVRIGVIAATAASALLLAACSSPGDQGREPFDGDPADVASGIDDAGFRIWHAALEEGENTVVSPASIGLAFGLAYAGASEPVLGAIEELFSLPTERDRTLAAFNSYENAITIPAGSSVRPEGAEEDIELPTVTVANRVFTDAGFDVRQEYLDTVAAYFGAAAEELPLSTDGESAARDINAWVSDETGGLIEDLVDPSSLTEDTRAMLVNAMYLLGHWEEPFHVDATRDELFTRLDGTTVTAPMMWNHSFTGDSARGDGFVAAFLPYAGDSLEMVLVVPDEGEYNAVESDFGPSLLARIDANRESGGYILGLPRFTAGSSVNLREAIEDGLGVSGLFGVEGLDGIGDRLAVDDASHATRVIVDEEGTEAAAATSIEAGVTSAPAEPELRIVADRPFLYVIRDVDTGAALFVGRVLDPTG